MSIDMNFVYDICGNIYINKNEEYYLININNEDNIECEKVLQKNYINTNEDIKIKKINKQNDLHIKSIESAISELNDDNSDDVKDEFNDIYDKYHSYIYNPEQRFYHDEIISDTDDDIDNTNFILKDREIKLFENSNSIIKKINFSFDIPMYEAIIIQGDIGTNNIIFRTEIINDQALYRLTIYTSGIILLNIIGTKIIKFIIDYDSLEITKKIYQNIKIY